MSVARFHDINVATSVERTTPYSAPAALVSAMLSFDDTLAPASQPRTVHFAYGGVERTLPASNPRAAIWRGSFEMRISQHG